MSAETLSKAGILSREVTIQAEHRLSGTLTVPKDLTGRCPAVLIVAGSGEIDRNGNVAAMGADMNIYRDLATVITDLGFVTLRYDKRGVGRSDGDYLSTGMWDLVSDLGACVKFLREQPEVDADRIFILGHSEGCMLATAYAARNEVAGLILLGGAGESIDDATRRQRQLAYSEMMSQKGIKGAIFRALKIDVIGEKQAQKLMDTIRNSTKDVQRVQFKPFNAKWLREHLAHDVKEDFVRLTCPILAVTGENDVQADPERLKNLPETAGGKVTWRIVGNMSHVLKEDSNRSILQIKKSYKETASKPLHPGLVEILTEWLSAAK